MSDLDEFPYCTWYSSVPHVATCEELLGCMRSIKLAVVRVCILRNYSDYWDELDADPDVNLIEDARKNPNLKYLCDLEVRIPGHGCHNFIRNSTYSIVSQKFMFEHTSTLVLDNVYDEPYADVEMGVPYNGRGANMVYIELCVSVLDELKNIALEELEDTGGFNITEYYNFWGENRPST
ncbi:hypothetical protein IFM53868_10639 [Aspergillus udagawae]|uniref:Uncharacterized protein n=1 Tax=Aspergillus udagawae TaxID=91492 RepID=A0ABQ1BEQ2_9EURO|nr:hypothetical protein IFM53868_10639 [Aspergillus udagawae]